MKLCGRLVSSPTRSTWAGIAAATAATRSTAAAIATARATAVSWADAHHDRAGTKQQIPQLQQTHTVSAQVDRAGFLASQPRAFCA